jgi:hypothetical protein
MRDCRLRNFARSDNGIRNVDYFSHGGNVMHANHMCAEYYGCNNASTRAPNQLINRLLCDCTDKRFP